LQGAGDPCRGRQGEEHPAGAVLGCVEQRVCCAAQGRRLPVVSHYVREGSTRSGTGHGARLPAVVGPPVEQRPPHERHAQVPGRRHSVDGGALRGGGGRRGGSGGGRWERGGARKGVSTGSCLLEGSDRLLAVGQVVQRLPGPRVAQRVAASPFHQHVGPAITHLEPAREQLRHFVLGLLWQCCRPSVPGIWNLALQ
jgi:hypothetical protein